MYVCMYDSTDGSAREVFEHGHLHHAIELGQQRQSGPHGRIPGLVHIGYCGIEPTTTTSTSTPTTVATLAIALISRCFRRMQLALIGFQNFRVRQVATYIHKYQVLVNMHVVVYTYILYIHTYIYIQYYSMHMHTHYLLE